jgi:uncharacterized protein YbjT (DUF2867 family)
MNPSKNALLIGASGLVGSHCLKILLEDEEFEQIEAWVRRPLEIVDTKLNCVVMDFGDISKISGIKATHVFCCLGTTISKAGSQAAFQEVDLEYVIELAKLAERSHVEKFIVISSIGANPASKNFYLRTKGKMEEGVKSCSIPSAIILRPSMLLGARQEFRLGEQIGKMLMRIFNSLLIGKLIKYRGIEANSVARAMVSLAKEESKGLRVVEYNQMQKWK